MSECPYCTGAGLVVVCRPAAVEHANRVVEACTGGSYPGAVWVNEDLPVGHTQVWPCERCSGSGEMIS